jgi:hypothetical protein
MTNIYTITSEKALQIIRNNYSFIMWYRLKSMPHANCKLGIVKVDVSADEDWYIGFLKSYDTVVAGFITDDTHVSVFCTGTYSPTTAKQITKFCREFCTPIDSHWMKRLAKTDAQAVVIDSCNLNSVIMQIISDYVGEKYGKAIRKYSER